jgi:CubicO group peptidase (beta-lactamase class C family)
MKLIFVTLMFFCYSSYYGISQKIDNQILIIQFENQLAKDVQEDQVGSISSAIFVSNKLVWSKAFGVADPVNKTYADTSTLYRIASVSKTFTVFLMMQMIEAGYFKLDDPVENFVPEIKKIKGYSDSNKITFRQLASHTSGLDKGPTLKNATIGPPEEWENKTILSIPTTRLISKPGLKYHYSNMGISIIGLAISRATNQSFIDLVKEKILIPLNMNNTFYKIPVAEMRRLSKGVNGARLNKINLKISDRDRQGRGYKLPAGGLITTPNDLAKFILTLMGKSDNKILSKESLRLMQTPVTNIDSSIFYGLGLFITKKDSSTIVGHGGSTSGYSSLFAFDTLNNNGVVLLRNYNKGKTNFDLSATNLLTKLSGR